MGKTILLGALQPLHPVFRAVEKLKGDPVRRNEHFLKYNISASTYDEGYARAYGEEYLGYLLGWLRRAAERGVDFLLLPEVVFQPGVVAMVAPGVEPNRHVTRDALRLYAWSEARFTEEVSRLCRESGMMVGACLPTARDGHIYNSGLIYDVEGKLPGYYDKIHLPPGEEDYYSPGVEYTVFDTRLGRFAFLICYDIQFPEAAACAELAGAQVFLHPSAGYTLPDEARDMGQNRLRVRASDHHCALAYSSFAPKGRKGPGSSQVIAQNGDVLDIIRGERAGLALGEVEVGRKRCWPKDGPDDPDRRAFVRQRRHPGTYGALVEPVAVAV